MNSFENASSSLVSYKHIMVNIYNFFFFNNVSTKMTKSALLMINNIKSLSPVNLPRLNKIYLFDIVDSHIIHYPSPIILTYAWSFGALSGICLVIQMVSGIFLSMHYTPHIDMAFSSVEYIMRDVKNGWLIRYVHANGVYTFFIVVYLHMCVVFMVF